MFGENWAGEHLRLETERVCVTSLLKHSEQGSGIWIEAMERMLKRVVSLVRRVDCLVGCAYIVVRYGNSVASHIRF